MYVRLAFAVAAHLEPEILIVDEVLAVGDAAFQKKCLGKMGDVAEKEGRTVLFVSHNMGAISSLCSKSMLLVQGLLNVMELSEKVISLYMSFGSTISNSEVCLINHPNRVLNHEQLITKIVTNLNEGNIAYYGQPLKIELYYDFHVPIITPQFVISIYTISGTRAFSLISDYQPNNVPKSLKGSGKISCNLLMLPLLPGAYFISLRLWQPGQKLDDIENILSFHVEWLDRDSNQLKWDNSLGVVYVDANWQLDSYNNHDC
jgi:lipopolysaccharide transport system ATP-binding protein